MKQRWVRLMVLAAVLLCLGGCAFSSPEELYAVPRAAEDYKNLQDQIDKVRSAGAEYAGPLFGTNTQPVQLMDLDGDGVQEAIAFFRSTSMEDPDPLKIYIYRQTADGNYEVWNIIEGDAPAINSISYEDLDGKTSSSGYMDKELVVSWRLSDKIYRLEAFSVTGEVVDTLLPAVSYTDYVLWDMDKDNQKEIVMITLNTVDSVYQADYYDYQSGQMMLRSSAPLSGKITGLASNTKPLASYLHNNGIAEPAVFVTSNLIIKEMTFLMARGAIISAILVIFVLPALLVIADKARGDELHIMRTPHLRPYSFKRHKKYVPVLVDVNGEPLRETNPFKMNKDERRAARAEAKLAKQAERNAKKEAKASKHNDK